MIKTSDLGHEALSCRIVERGTQSEGKCDHIDLLGGRDASYRQHAQRRGAERQPRLGDFENLPLVEAIRDQAAVRGQQQHRQELQARGDAYRERRTAGELEHQPVLGHPLHPGADVGDERPRQIDAVVALDQCGEHATSSRRGWCCRPSATSLRSGLLEIDAHPWFTFSSTRIARRNTSRSAGSSPAIRTASHSSRRRRFASSTCRPESVSVTRHCR